MTTTSLPVCAVLNLSPLTSEDVLTRKLLPKENLQPTDDDANTRRWSIDNKYYECSVNVTVLSEAKSSLDGEAAVVFCGQFSTSEHRQVACDWLTASTRAESEVRLLVVDGWKEEKDSDAIREWAANEGIEIIDFSEDDDDDTTNEDDEDAPFSSTGPQRIREALHTCPWSNMVMREQTQERRATVETDTDSSANNGTTESSTNGQEQQPSLLSRLSAEEPTEESMESFEELFSQFAALKSRAGALPEADRKAYAEQVVTSFWKALGGDEGELEGLEEPESE